MQTEQQIERVKKMLIDPQELLKLQPDRVAEMKRSLAYSQAVRHTQEDINYLKDNGLPSPTEELQKLSEKQATYIAPYERAFEKEFNQAKNAYAEENYTEAVELIKYALTSIEWIAHHTAEKLRYDTVETAIKTGVRPHFAD